MSVLNSVQRAQVLLERYKTGQVNDLAGLLAELSQVEVAIVSAQGGLGVSWTELKKLMKELNAAQEEVIQKINNGTIKKLKDLNTQQMKLERDTLKQNVIGKNDQAPSPETDFNAGWKSVLSSPLSANGMLLEPFIKTWGDKHISSVNNLVQRAWQEGWPIGRLMQGMRGTKAAGFQDGLIALTRRQAEAVSRTAIQHVAQGARMAMWEANDDLVTGYRWVSTLDGVTSNQCKSLDGQVFPLGKGPRPPIHINCRSTTIPQLGPEWDYLDEGATRSSKDGYVSAKETYYSWLKKQPPEFQDEALGKTRAKLFREGGLTAEQFAALNLNKNFQPMTLAQMAAAQPTVFSKAGVKAPPLTEKQKAQAAEEAAKEAQKKAEAELAAAQKKAAAAQAAAAKAQAQAEKAKAAAAKAQAEAKAAEEKAKAEKKAAEEKAAADAAKAAEEAKKKAEGDESYTTVLNKLKAAGVTQAELDEASKFYASYKEYGTAGMAPGSNLLTKTEYLKKYFEDKLNQQLSLKEVMEKNNKLLKLQEAEEELQYEEETMEFASSLGMDEDQFNAADSYAQALVKSPSNIDGLTKIEAFKKFAKELFEGAPPDKPKPAPAKTSSKLLPATIPPEGKKYVEIQTTNPSQNSIFKNQQPLERNSEVEESVELYAGSGYTQINNHLRGKAKNAAQEAQTPRTLKHIANIDKAMKSPNSTLQSSLHLFRGFSAGPIKMDELIGATLKEPGYVSTSLQQTTAISFARSRPNAVVFRIRSEAGQKGIVMNRQLRNSPHAGEQEILLPRGTTFRILRRLDPIQGAEAYEVEIVPEG